MDGNSVEMTDHVPAQVAAPSREARRSRRKPARTGEATLKAHLAQVSVYVPRELVAAFDDAASAQGVNRSHLIREALIAYAALLDAGCRVYEVPGIARRDARAA